MQGSSSLQKQPGSGCKAHPCKKIWGYLSGIAQRGRFKTMPVPPQAFAGPVSPMLVGGHGISALGTTPRVFGRMEWHSALDSRSWRWAGLLALLGEAGRGSWTPQVSVWCFISSRHLTRQCRFGVGRTRPGYPKCPPARQPWAQLHRAFVRYSSLMYLHA